MGMGVGGNEDVGGMVSGGMVCTILSNIYLEQLAALHHNRTQAQAQSDPTPTLTAYSPASRSSTSQSQYPLGALSFSALSCHHPTPTSPILAVRPTSSTVHPSRRSLPLRLRRPDRSESSEGGEPCPILHIVERKIHHVEWLAVNHKLSLVKGEIAENAHLPPDAITLVKHSRTCGLLALLMRVVVATSKQ